jgi:serine protease
MLAESGNGIGVEGVLEDAPHTNNVCLMVARVFDDDERGQSDSVIASAAEWCVDNGAKIINMSLGSPGFPSNTMDEIYKNIRYNDQVLIFSASGNAGDNELNYPASYEGVIGVGAVAHDLTVANFSVTNSAVDLVAPGSEIMSTVPKVLVYDTASNVHDTVLMQFSKSLTNTISGSVIDCGLGQEPCGDATGKICLLARGEVTFAKKARNCEKGGGVAALVYNDIDGIFGGTLSSPGFVRIPVATVSKAAGAALKASSTVKLAPQESGYEVMSGTSMATPYAAAVAAKIWAVRPNCTADQIEEALFKSARDLGTPGRDDQYGNGLVQAEAAYLYLQNFPAPCGGFTVTNTRRQKIRAETTAQQNGSPSSSLRGHKTTENDAVITTTTKFYEM